jgi:hypothetical protein
MRSNGGGLPGSCGLNRHLKIASRSRQTAALIRHPGANPMGLPSAGSALRREVRLAEVAGIVLIVTSQVRRYLY